MADEIKLTFIVDFRAGVEFTPTPDPDGGVWGPWECWRNCVGGDLPNGTVGLLPTGDWLCWNRDTDYKCGFADATHAEMFCVYQNASAPTRVVDPFTGQRASTFIFSDLATKVDAELAKGVSP